MCCTDLSIPRTGGVIYGLHLGDHVYRYIGQTIQTPRRRFTNHFSEAKGSRRAVAKWLTKHGAEVQMCIIEEFELYDQDVLDAREIFYINQHETYSLLKKGGLNHTLGGGGVSGNTHTEETRARMSASRRGKPRPDAVGNKYCLGYKHTDEARAIMSAKAKNRVVSVETRAKLSAVRKGREVSEEARANISAAQLASKSKGLGAHNRWHLDRNIINPDCTHCKAGTTEVGQNV